MNDHELDQLIARANPYGDAKVRHLPIHGAEHDLLEDIISTETPETRPAPEPAGTVPGPAVAEPAVARAVVAGPVVAGDAGPGVAGPAAVVPGAAVPGFAGPGAAVPGAAGPGTAVPGSAGPGAQGPAGPGPAGPDPAIPGPASPGPAVPSAAPAVPTIGAQPRRRRIARRRATILLAAAATVAVVLTGVFFPKGSSPIAPVSAYGAEFRAVTDATPRLLLDDPDWRIDSVPVFRANEGEIKFARGKQTLQVNWIPGRENGGKPESTIQVLGQTGKLYRFGGRKSTDFFVLLPPKGAYYLTLRGDVGSDAGFRRLIGKLRTVDTDTWLDAMPDTIVKQSDAPRVIDEMLADVPVPNGFDRTPFLKILVLDRYHFAAKVTGSIACTWLDQWAAAKQTGDTVKLEQARAALTGSRNWKILQELDRQGGWAGAVWAADEAVTGKRDLQNARNGMGCPR